MAISFSEKADDDRIDIAATVYASPAVDWVSLRLASGPASLSQRAQQALRDIQSLREICEKSKS
jgi:hypothetical protein